MTFLVDMTIAKRPVSVVRKSGRIFPGKWEWCEKMNAYRGNAQRPPNQNLRPRIKKNRKHEASCFRVLK